MDCRLKLAEHSLEKSDVTLGAQYVARWSLDVAPGPPRDQKDLLLRPNHVPMAHRPYTLFILLGDNVSHTHKALAWRAAQDLDVAPVLRRRADDAEMAAVLGAKGLDRRERLGVRVDDVAAELKERFV